MNREACDSKAALLSGACFLTVSTVIVKLTGLLYKIPILSILGTEGMGYFNSAYECYLFFCTVATAGLPVAISVLVAEAIASGQPGRAERIYRISLELLFAFGLFGSLFLALFAKSFCTLIKSPNACYSLLAVSPTLFFVCLSAAVRGYFQGLQKMLPTAISQLIEAVGKLTFGLCFAWIGKRAGYGEAVVASFAGFGLTFGSFLSYIYLLIEKRKFSLLKDSTEDRSDRKGIMQRLLHIAVPLTLGVALTSLCRISDMAMILRRLQENGYSPEEANEVYGSYTTLALSIFSLLPTLVNSLILPLVPLISSAIARKSDREERELTAFALRTVGFVGIPAAIAMAVFAEPILNFLFGSHPEAVAVSAPLLSLLGVSSFLSAMIGTVSAILHAKSVVFRPILCVLLGTVIKSVSAYFLIGNPAVSILGAPISTFLCNLTVAVLCTRLLQIRETDFYPTLKFGAFLSASVLSCGLVGWIFSELPEGNLKEKAVILLVFASSALLYLFLSRIFGGWKKTDFSFRLAQKGGKIKKI